MLYKVTILFKCSPFSYHPFSILMRPFALNPYTFVIISTYRVHCLNDFLTGFCSSFVLKELGSSFTTSSFHVSFARSFHPQRQSALKIRSIPPCWTLSSLLANLVQGELNSLQWKNEYQYSFAHDRHLSSRLFSCSMQCSVSKIHLITKNAHYWSFIDMDFQPMSLERSKLRAKSQANTTRVYWLCPRWKDVVPLAACWFR
jgi:hypothetical protein